MATTTGHIHPELETIPFKDCWSALRDRFQPWWLSTSAATATTGFSSAALQLPSTVSTVADGFKNLLGMVFALGNSKSIQPHTQLTPELLPPSSLHDIARALDEFSNPSGLVLALEKP